MYIALTSFRAGVLPWTTCDNQWNTMSCRSRMQENNTRTEVNYTQVNTTVSSYSYLDRNETGNITLKTTTPTTEFWE